MTAAAPSGRIRVLTLVDSLTDAGGAERFAATTVIRLDPTRFDRTLCSSRPSSGPLVRGLEDAGVRVVSLDRRSSASLLQWRALLRLLRRERVDVLHAHKFGSNVWGTVLGRLARVPVVVAHEHTWSFEGRPLRRFLDRHLIARGADVFLAVSEADRRRMIEIERIDPERVRVLPNGIPPLPAASGRDVRAALGIAEDAPVVVSVGILRPQKATANLVRAAARLAPEHPGLRVLIVGGGPERARLEALVRELGLGEAVTLLGMRDDVPDLLAAADVAANASDFEGTPLAVLEYMAAGKAIVATRVGGVPDVIEDRVQGVLVEPGDVEALAREIGSLLRDPARRAELGARARERQELEFDLDTVVRRLEALYDELVERKR